MKKERDNSQINFLFSLSMECAVWTINSTEAEQLHASTVMALEAVTHLLQYRESVYFFVMTAIRALQ